MNCIWRNNLKFNMQTKGLPEMINKNNLDNRFGLSNDNMISDARDYFREDPLVWHFPAKNYFVRICLAYYVSKKFNGNRSTRSSSGH